MAHFVRVTPKEKGHNTNSPDHKKVRTSEARLMEQDPDPLFWEFKDKKEDFEEDGKMEMEDDHGNEEKQEDDKDLPINKRCSEKSNCYAILKNENSDEDYDNDYDGDKDDDKQDDDYDDNNNNKNDKKLPAMENRNDMTPPPMKTPTDQEIIITKVTKLDTPPDHDASEDNDLDNMEVEVINKEANAHDRMMTTEEEPAAAMSLKVKQQGTLNAFLKGPPKEPSTPKRGNSKAKKPTEKLPTTEQTKMKSAQPTKLTPPANSQAMTKPAKPTDKLNGQKMKEQQTKTGQQAMIASNVQKNVLYIRGAIKAEKSSQSVAVMHKGLKNYHKTMCNVDPTIVWYKGKKSHPLELDTIMSPDKWPTLSMKMKEFAHDIRPRSAGSMCYFVARVGFDGEMETFKEDVNGPVELVDGTCYPNMLQVLEVVENDFIMNSYPGMNDKWWTKEWMDQMNKMARKEGKAIKFTMALIDKPIYLGKGYTNFLKIKDRAKKKKRMMVQRGLHATSPKNK